MVVLLTPNAIASAWVRHEVDAAIVRERDKETELIPLEVEDCDVPALWNNYQRISFRDYKKGFTELQKALTRKKPGNKIRISRSESKNSGKVNISRSTFV